MPDEPRQDGAPRRDGRGRRTKLTQERHDQIVTLLKVGNYLSTAAAAVGVDEGTLHRWLRYGQNPKGPAAFRHFRQACTTARAVAQSNLVTMVRSAAAHDWRAAAWMLEKLAPDHWGARAHLHIEGELTQHHEGHVDLGMFSDEELETWHRLLGKLQAAQAMAPEEGSS